MLWQRLKLWHCIGVPNANIWLEGKVKRNGLNHFAAM